MERFLSYILWLFVTKELPAAVIIDDFRTGALAFTSTTTIRQNGLDTSHVWGGQRTVSGNALNAAAMDAQVDTTKGVFSYSSQSYGYFTLSYIIDSQRQMDLIGAGYTAFRMDFSYVDPSFWRGLYDLTVNGVRHNVSTPLFAVEGAGVIEVPFSRFTNQPTFTPREIIFSASRVEPNLRMELSSLSVIPEPRIPLLLAIAAVFTAVSRGKKRGEILGQLRV
jgi:hypothetical protein